MIDNTWAKGPASGYIPPQSKGTEGVSATEVSNKLGTALEDCCNSNDFEVIREKRQKLQ